MSVVRGCLTSSANVSGSTVSLSDESARPTLSLHPPKSTSLPSPSPRTSTTPTLPRLSRQSRPRRENSSARARRRRLSQKRRSRSRRCVGLACDLSLCTDLMFRPLTPPCSSLSKRWTTSADTSRLLGDCPRVTDSTSSSSEYDHACTMTRYTTTTTEPSPGT